MTAVCVIFHYFLSFLTFCASYGPDWLVVAWETQKFQNWIILVPGTHWRDCLWSPKPLWDDNQKDTRGVCDFSFLPKLPIATHNGSDCFQVRLLHPAAPPVLAAGPWTACMAVSALIGIDMTWPF